jgi:hypothetical protein
MERGEITKCEVDDWYERIGVAEVVVSGDGVVLLTTTKGLLNLHN